MSDLQKLILLKETLQEIAEEVAGHHDIKDGADGPGPNWAMQLTAQIDYALAKVGK